MFFHCINNTLYCIIYILQAILAYPYFLYNNIFYLFVLVVLLDTTTEPSLRWTTYPYGPDANAAGVSQ